MREPVTCGRQAPCPEPDQRQALLLGNAVERAIWREEKLKRDDSCRYKLGHSRSSGGGGGGGGGRSPNVYGDRSDCGEERAEVGSASREMVEKAREKEDSVVEGRGSGPDEVSLSKLAAFGCVSRG